MTNIDGSPITDLDGYKIYHGTAPGVYHESIDVGDALTYTFQDLALGEHYFAATSYNLSGVESSLFSNEVFAQVP